jgi:hypothetical protein
VGQLGALALGTPRNLGLQTIESPVLQIMQLLEPALQAWTHADSLVVG